VSHSAASQEKHAAELKREHERVATKHAAELKREKERAKARLDKGEAEREEQRQRALAEAASSHSAKLSGATAQANALERQLAEVKQQAAEQLAAEAAKEKQARVELLHKQAMRRVLNADLSNGWSAWAEMWRARSYAMNKLRDVANSLKAPELSNAFSFWTVDIVETKKQAAYKEMLDTKKQLEEQLAVAQKMRKDLQHCVRSEDAETAAAAIETRYERQLAEAKAAAEQMQALAEANAKEERVELLRKQAVRRVMNAGMASGWAAWVELWEAKTYAMKRLRQVGNTLKAPEKLSAFDFWAAELWEAKREAERKELLSSNHTLEGQLRYAHYELGQVTLLKAAQDDELAGLRARLSEVTVGGKDVYAKAREADIAKKELSELQGLYHEAQDEADEARRRAGHAETEVASQRQAAERLLRRLLEEQRKEFDRETKELKQQLAAKSEREEREARVEVLRTSAARRIRNAGIARAWDVWQGQWAARVDAINLLSVASARLSRPALFATFQFWRADWHAYELALLSMTKEEQLELKDEERQEVEAELCRARAELTQVVAQRDELQRKVYQLSGDDEEARAMLQEQAAAEKGKRVESFGRQVVRRMLHDGVRRGWTAWLERHEARKYALGQLQRTAVRLRTYKSRDAFDGWRDDLADARMGVELVTLKRSEARLKEAVRELQATLEGERASIERRLAHAEAEKATALERLRIELVGSRVEREAVMEEKAKEERVEQMRRQSIRRIANKDLAAGWEAWVELWEAKTYAMKRLRQVGNRLKRPEVAIAFSLWSELLVQKYEAERYARMSGLQRREKDLEAEVADLEAEVKRVHEWAQAQQAKAEEDKKLALDRMVLELTGSAEEILALKETEAKEQRVELLRRQVGRRMMNQGIASGWSAWHELWEAKRYAMARLQACGNKLRAPAMETAFSFWQSEQLEAKRVADWQQLEAQSKSLEAQLRHARYEIKQTTMIRTAQVDEIGALRDAVASLSEERALLEAKVAEYAHLPDDLVRAREEKAAADELAREATAKKEEAEADVLRQLDASNELLERLLKEQRQSLTKSSDDLKGKLATETKLRTTQAAELSRLKEAATRTAKEHEAESKRLHDEIKKLTPPPKPKPKPKTRLGNLDLDEGPDAPPIAEQLANALRENSTRVLDLFRSWDADGDGQVSRAEFHKAMPALGLDVPKETIDELFSSWDKDGGGELGYAELRRILSEPRRQKTAEKPPASVSEKSPAGMKSAAVGVKAVAAMSKMKK